MKGVIEKIAEIRLKEHPVAAAAKVYLEFVFQ